MLTSLAIIFLLGLLASSLFNKLKLPSLTGMIIVGIIISPYAFNLLDESILSISSDLRQLALVIILTRAGLSLDINDLKKVGRPAILLCFIPALFEIIGFSIFGPILLNISINEALLIGSIVAAVSPAVIVPRMLKLMDEKIGTEKSIPQMILAGASLDDIFVIVLFYSFITLNQGGTINFMTFINIPISILMGILVGYIVGILLIKLFKYKHMRDSVKIIIILSMSFLLIELEHQLQDIIQISGLIAIMTLAITINQKYRILAIRLQNKYNRLWVAAEILLFVLVGATVNLKYAISFGAIVILVIILSLLVRIFGVFICLIKTKLNPKEKVFCMISYTPKATVQAAIGAIPLQMGLACGNLAITTAVLAILITAPIGAFLIDYLYKKLLV